MVFGHACSAPHILAALTYSFFYNVSATWGLNKSIPPRCKTHWNRLPRHNGRQWRQPRQGPAPLSRHTQRVHQVWSARRTNERSGSSSSASRATLNASRSFTSTWTSESNFLCFFWVERRSSTSKSLLVIISHRNASVSTTKESSKCKRQSRRVRMGSSREGP